MTSINLELEEPTFQQLSQIAIKQGKSSLDLVHELIARYLEDTQDINLATEAITRLEKGESYTLSLDELEERLHGIQR
jgi:predicted DNA-binding protein